MVPTDLEARGGDATVTLDWADNGEADIAGYTVYRVQTSGGPYHERATVTASTYSDHEVANGTTYYYVVTAVDTNANESELSAEVQATPSVQQAVTIAADGFESNNFTGGTGWWTPWRKRGDGRLLQTNPTEGRRYVRLRRMTGYLKRPVELTEVSGVHLVFWTRMKSFEGTDRALV